MTDLVGVKLSGWRKRLPWIASSTRALAIRGSVPYCASLGPVRKAAPEEARSTGRKPARLNWGKLLDEENRFLCECRIHDRSASGFRLVVARDASPPQRCHLYCDLTGDIFVVQVVWRRGAALGVRVRGVAPRAQLKASDRFALRGHYYAVSD